MKTKSFISVILILVMVLTLCGCKGADEKKAIKETINSFEDSFKELDIEGMLDCVDPRVAKTIKAGTSLLGGILGGDYTMEMISSLVYTIFNGPFEFEGRDFFEKLSIKVLDITVDNDEAIAECHIKYSLDGSQYDEDVSFKMIKKKGKWYIAGVGN